MTWERARSPRASCLARTMPSTTGFTHSRWDGLGATLTVMVSPVSATWVPVAPRWYFTSPEPWVESGSVWPSNSEKIWPERLAHRVGEDVQAAAVRHADDRFLHAFAGGVVQDAVQKGDERLPTLQGEAFVADVLRVQEALEALRLHQLLEGPLLARDVQGRVVPRRLHAVLQPVLALGVGDVHVLDADGVAVGVAQDLQDLAQGRLVPAREAARDELAVEVPQGEAVGRGVEVAVGRALAVQGVEVGHQVAAHAVVVDEGQDLGLLLDLLAAARGAAQAGRRVHLPAHRPVRQAQVLEDALVEAVLALQQVFHAGEEEARLRALDDAVVVGRGHGHDLADPEQAQGARRPWRGTRPGSRGCRWR